MNEKERVLEMIEQGKISAKDGMDLLSAMEETNEITVGSTEAKVYKTLKVVVNVAEEDVNVNINIPLQLIKILGSAFKDIASLVPADAQHEISSRGIDLSAIDINGIIAAIESGSLDNATLVDINVKSKTDGDVMVKVYVD